MQWSLRNKVLAGYGLMLVLTVVVGFLGLAASHTLSWQLTEAGDVLAPSLSEAEDVGRTMAVARQILDNLVISRPAAASPELPRTTRALAGKIETVLADLDRMEQRRPAEPRRAAVVRLRTLLTEWDRQGRAALALTADQRHEEAAEGLVAARQTLSTADQTMNALVDDLRRDLQDLAVHGRGSDTIQQISLVILLVMASGVAASRVAASQRTTAKMQRMSTSCVEAGHDLQSAAGQVSMSAQSLAQTASEQAASLEETSATMEELASMTKQNADRAQQVATLMHEADAKVSESNGAMRAATQSMTAIEESSHKVARILKTIDEITFQTNILALNAAVEAARAGEAGLGFAAVAEEVRNLAQRSANAAKDTAALVEESVSKSRDGRQTVGQLGTALDDITRHLRQVRELADEVSLASRQQAQGIEQVSEAIAQMEQVTQMMATTSEENAAASAEVNAHAGVAIRVASELRWFVDGRSAAVGPEASAAAANPILPAGPTETVRKVVKMAAPAKHRSVLDTSLADTGTYRSF